MKRTAPLLVSFALLAAVLAGAFHRHVSHDGGLSPEHVDCVVCAWTQRDHVPSIHGGASALEPDNASGRFALLEKPRSGFFSASSFQPRAPPAL